MIELNICFFERSEKKTIFGNMDAEYALDRENGAQILMGDNGFCSIYEVQNVENLDFSKIFESFHFQLHHTPEWANSDRISLMWLILRSERSFEIFEIFEKLIIPIPDMPRFRHLR